MKPFSVRVITPYQSSFPDPLQLPAGLRVAVTDKKTHYEGWLWCTDPAGKSGWVPQSYLARRGGSAVLLRDYDATELTVQFGEELLVSEEESGWYWCRAADGRRGWVPAEHVERSDPQ